MKIKDNLYYLILALPFVFYSCESTGPVGPQGPPGPEGPQGLQGESGYIFEYENVDFTGPDYELFLDYPQDFEGFDSDVALVYLLWDVQTDTNGNDLEIWRQIPQTLFIEYGTLIYNFDHSKFDVHLFLDADFDLDLLTAIDTDDWVVRIVVVPASYWSRTSIDYSDYYAVKEAYGLPDLEKHETAEERR